MPLPMASDVGVTRPSVRLLAVISIYPSTHILSEGQPHDPFLFWTDRQSLYAP